MEEIRRIASLVLNLRNELKIKIRQPLRKLKVKSLKFKVNKELLDILKEEINVKEIIFDNKIKDEIELDTAITPELKEEGIIREIVRKIQDLRGDASCVPKDKIFAFIHFEKENINNLIQIPKNEKAIKQEINASFLKVSREEKINASKEIIIDDIKGWIGIKKLTH